MHWQPVSLVVALGLGTALASLARAESTIETTRTLPASPAAGRPALQAAFKVLWNFESSLEADWVSEGSARNWKPVCEIMSDSPGARVPANPPRAEAPEALVSPARLGGDYWIVPFPAGPRGCLLDTREKPEGKGKLISPEFVATFRYLEFLVGAGCGDACESTRVELRLSVGTTATGPGPIKGSPPVVTKALAPGTPQMRRVVWDLQALGVQGRKLRLAIVDESPNHGITVDEIRNADSASKDPVRMPLFGFADLHTHFFTQMGFGGRLFAGSIHSSVDRTGVISNEPSDPAKALKTCHYNHGTAPDGEGVTTLIPEQGHHAEGWPTFRGWPRFTSKSHQQMYVDWLKRAWEGGLRLVHMDVVNNSVMPKLFEITSPLLSKPINPNEYVSDEWSINRQIEAAKKFAELPDVKPWLAIAYTPEQARDIVAQGKLAMVLGVEVDDLGDFTKNRTFMSLARRAETGDTVVLPAIRLMLNTYVKKLYEQGVRHVIPIHVSDNVFGGSAVYDLLVDAGGYLWSRLVLGHHPHPARKEVGASPVRLAKRGEGIFSRLDLEYEEMGKTVRQYLKYTDPKKVVEDQPWVVLIPAALPIVIAIVPAVAVFLPFLAATATALVELVQKLVKELDGLLGLTSFLEQRLREFPLVMAGGRDATVGYANALGLSAAGRILLEELMRKGMVIDISHMSELSANETLKLAQKYSYPVIASHTGFRETGFGAWIHKRPETDRSGRLFPAKLPGTQVFSSPLPAGDLTWRRASGVADPGTVSYFGTNSPAQLANERGLSPEQVRIIRDLGGLVGLGTGSAATPIAWPPGSPPRAAGVRGEWLYGPDCDGSTKAFIPNYLYAVEKLGGVGIALGTDANGLAGGTGPRFGTYACSGSVGDAVRDRAGAQAEAQLRQRNAVVYDVKLGDAIRNGFPERFGGGGAYTGEQVTIWMAIGMFKAGKADRGEEVPYAGCRNLVDRGQWRDVARIAWGFQRAALERPAPGNYCGNTDTAADAKAAWEAYDRYYRRGKDYGGLPSYGSVDNTKISVRNIMNVLSSFERMAGTNVPLRKILMREADFDFNIDGLAHYGMLPDMIQDVKNGGALTPKELAPLFRGAEDYVLMWEKIEARKGNVRTSP